MKHIKLIKTIMLIMFLIIFIILIFCLMILNNKSNSENVFVCDYIDKNNITSSDIMFNNHRYNILELRVDCKLYKNNITLKNNINKTYSLNITKWN